MTSSLLSSLRRCLKVCIRIQKKKKKQKKKKDWEGNVRVRVDHVTPLCNTNPKKKFQPPFTWRWGHSWIPHFHAWEQPPFECRDQNGCPYVGRSKVDMSLLMNVRVQNQRDLGILDPFWHIQSEFEAIKIRLITHTGMVDPT